ncbi:fumarylacetoacetate hydrolase family protein [Georgenia yuyongxinii]|uniref:Fumarylacetoacetate hydrolase family protein n=1 Tax=Georgenia yuyongxinii TaxID=2589797 RepID=A0A552WXJ5_9MICO|nr:fumarylacetoacetate hydrolase family protein [Georgenia yuyongxinii]TRW47550.1 fumarylacetoacetate hydrolase family protein [Georgenia yuyongxinii]
MRLATYKKDNEGSTSWGVEETGGTVIDGPALYPTRDEAPATLLELIQGGPDALSRLRSLVAASDPETSMKVLDPVLLAPLKPGKIIGVGLNYVDHVAESSRSLDTDASLPTRPVLFSKPGTAVVGPNGPILHNSELTNQLDWECELAVVIGMEARNVAVEDALDYVFGYSIINDISARDQRRSGQWFFSKGQDSYAPLGPAIVLRDAVTDPHDLDLSLLVNGVQMQNGNTRDMLFKIPQLIADITSGMTLEPGDVIATGSPQGVGAAMDPPQYLQPGDEVVATISGIGSLTNYVTAVTAPINHVTEVAAQ